jgi:hypothetical protein
MPVALAGLFDVAHQLAWRDVPAQGMALAQRCEKVAKAVQQVMFGQPGWIAVEYMPNDYSAASENLTLNVLKSANGPQLREQLFEKTGRSVIVRTWDDVSNYCPSEWSERNIKVAMAPLSVLAAREKRAYSKNLRGLMSVLGWNPDTMRFPGWPSPAAAMLATGALGAGAGYGVGMLGEHLLPSTWQRNKLRKTMAIIGGLGGAATAVPWMAANVGSGKEITDGWPLDTPPILNYDEMGKQSEEYDIFRDDARHTDIHGDLNVYGRINSMPDIDVPRFTNTVWNDPYVASRLTPHEQAAAAGLMLGASHLAGGGQPARLITPWDVGKMTAGMGTGYLAGALIGKTLGVLAGMPDETQNTLKRTGMWAGAVSTLLPLAFGA